MEMLFHHEKCHCLYIQKNNHSKELKYNKTQPNSTEPMKMLCLDQRVGKDQESRSDQLLKKTSLTTYQLRPPVQTTFDMEVKRARRLPGAAGNATCRRNSSSSSSWLAQM